MIDKASDLQLYVRILRHAKRYWWHIVVIFAVSLLATPLALLAPLPLKIAIDNVLGADPLPPLIGSAIPAAVETNPTLLLIFAAALIVVLKLAARMQSLAANILKTYTGEKLVLSFQSELFQHAQRLSLTYHDSMGTSDSVYRVQTDANSVREVAVNSVVPFLASMVTLVAMITVTARIDWQLALVALVAAPALAGLTAYYRTHMRAQWRSVKKAESGALAVVQEVLSNLRVVKAFSQEDREQKRFERQYEAGVRARLRTMLLQGGFWTLVSLTTATGTAFVLYLGVRHVQTGVLTLGSLLLVMSYIGQMYTPLSSISERVTGLQKALASAERAFALLDQPQDVHEREDARRVGRTHGAIEFRNVSFGYGNSLPLLKDVNVKVWPGARVGVLGQTGAGKTTLMGLLTRFYDPQEGEILLDGVDVRECRLDDLRGQFAIVLQEPVLFSTSIRDNIAYANPEASDEQIKRAAEAANIHRFIEQLPEGYATNVGERGMRLSGGERQRVALARAFLKDAPILILDEPTSSVDIGTEGAIFEALQRLMHGRTAFIVAHRLSTLESCDLLIHLDHGVARLITDQVAAELERVQQAGTLEAFLPRAVRS